jgi:hypothetical protein
LDVGQPQTFTSSVSGGTGPYSYQWYLNGVAVSGAKNPTWTFFQISMGTYNVYLNVTDSVGATTKSNVAQVTVTTGALDLFVPLIMITTLPAAILLILLAMLAFKKKPGRIK